MKYTAAWLAVRALENLGVRYTFGIPGVHNTELYDELADSKTITPILVTHEGGAAFMADAVSRTSASIGTLAIVPAAGLTQAASGIAEAFLDGVPMLVISGGIRTDSNFRYQLHEIDQHAFMRPLTKATFHAKTHAEVVPMLYEAHRIATSGMPGPVFVELPVNLQLQAGAEHVVPPAPAQPPPAMHASAVDIERAAALLLQAKHPRLFVGWGARGGAPLLEAIAEHLQAPVATTLQGLSAFPAQHPLHTGFSFGPHAVPASRNAFADCDALLAVGTRFGELATGSFGIRVPSALVHVDIDPDVFSVNYPAAVALEGDAHAVLSALLDALRRQASARATDAARVARIAQDKRAYRDTWRAHDSASRVNPCRFFDALRAAMPDDCITVVDDGNHTYLTAELWPAHAVGSVILPTDFNCMGYAVPAAIGAKLANREREVFAIVGDGAFLMTCMEIVTANALGLGVIFFVFHDGELSQIAQAQEIPMRRKTCSVLGDFDAAGVAQATGAAFVAIADDAALGDGIAQARRLAGEGRPVIVDVRIDYSKRTAFTEGVVKTNFKRLPLPVKLRMLGRIVARKFRA
jgi:acetolactate synthase-1/2/3 large subunit